MQSSGDPQPLAEGLLGHGQGLGDRSEGWHRLVAQTWISPECLCNPLLSPRVFQGGVRRFFPSSKKVMCLDLHSRNRSSSGIRITQPAPNSWAAACFSTTAEDQGPLWAPWEGSRRRRLVHSAAQRCPGCSSTDTAVVESLGAYATKQRREQNLGDVKKGSPSTSLESGIHASSALR